MLTKEQYLAAPCRTSSLPFWKAITVAVPDTMRILHQDAFIGTYDEQYCDEAYFRLLHPMNQLPIPILPKGYCLCRVSLSDFASHINRCYSQIGMSEAELMRYTERDVYEPSLWVSVAEIETNTVVATGIGELDRQTGEGILEWIQVSPNHRRKGLGKYLVSELLNRMKGKADFVTVSGQCQNPTAPELLYRNCGFTGTDIWHVLRRKK